MSGQTINGIETYPFFISIDKKLKYNKHFITVTDTTCTCTVCKKDLTISIDSTDSIELQTSLFVTHVRKKRHLKNVMNYVFSKICPGTPVSYTHLDVYKRQP